MGKIKNFFSGVRNEMKAVTWPTSRELKRNSLIVFGVCLIFAVFFMVVDFGIVSILDLIF
ncbi:MULTISPECIES: preprotein translocase subunit SecE [Carnobacterium]|uniref:preprotein translocase subunit SecE n=1 Tax=Carnobacterium TaxID=2747 RepID=UPI0005525317|nr:MULTISPECIES: preprotein translocase subunit SecE [Carnobacterium]